MLSRVRKLSVKLLRSSVCEACQFCLLRKLSVQLPRSSVLCQKMKKMPATPKVVHTPATVSSLGNCPYTCHRQQFYPQFLLWLKLPRSAGVRTISQTAVCGLCTQVFRLFDIARTKDLIPNIVFYRANRYVKTMFNCILSTMFSVLNGIM